jgi:hypothetical protein
MSKNEKKKKEAIEEKVEKVKHKDTHLLKFQFTYTY